MPEGIIMLFISALCTIFVENHNYNRLSMLSACTSVLFVTCVYSSLWSWVIIIFPHLLTINQAPMTYCYYVLFNYCDGMPTVCNTAQCPCNHMRHSIPSQCPRGMFRVLIREELCIPNLVLVCRSMNWVSAWEDKMGIMRRLCCNEQGIASIGRLLEPALCTCAAGHLIPVIIICIFLYIHAYGQFISRWWFFFVAAVRLISRV